MREITEQEKVDLWNTTAYFTKAILIDEKMVIVINKDIPDE